MTDGQWTEIFENTFRPAIEAVGYACQRSALQPGNFVKDILQSLNVADIVLADLSGRKPNVFYELGIRHALKRHGTILVAQSIDDIPSDLRSYSCIQYGWTTTNERYKFQRDIADAITSLDDQPDHTDSPVADYLDLPGQQDITSIRILPGKTAFYPDPASRQVAFAHVQVINAGPFAPRARCGIRFFRMDRSPVFADEMPGRWSGSPEPTSPVGIGSQIISVADASKIPMGYVFDFAAKEETAVALAVKFADSQECWGWTQDSYFTKWQPSSWKLPMERLRARVRIVVNGVEYSNEFLLDTTLSVDEFAVYEAGTGATAGDSALTRDVQVNLPKRPDRSDVDRRL